MKTRVIGRGVLTAVLRGPDGRVKDRRVKRNLVVTTGLGHIADRLSDAGEGAMSHLAIGTGTTAAAAGDTTLVTEAARVALDSTTGVAAVVTYVATFAAGTGTGAITESGVLNAASAGVLLNRSVFAVINKGALDSLEMTFDLTLSAA